MQGLQMMYQSYQTYENLIDPVRFLAGSAEKVTKRWWGNLNVNPVQRLAAYYEQLALLGFTHVRPDFGIEKVTDSFGLTARVTEEVVFSTPFCQLLHFKKEYDADQNNGIDHPKVLLVAPMSGHFATLLSGTVKTLLRDHDVYITDWQNIRDIAPESGVFDFDSYVEHVLLSIEAIGEGVHLIGVCQPTVACLIATAVLSEDKSPLVPRSLTLMAGPIDVRINPTKVNELANQKPIEWFKEKLIGIVPAQFPGAGRSVYPGFIQLTAFMSMNAERHMESFQKLYEYRVAGKEEKADAIHNFYAEYFAIMDLSAPFYLETVEKIFQKCELATGVLTYKGRLVNPRAIRKTFLLTVEGERDDICGLGQTLAAQDLCSALPGYMKSHHMQAGVGHYGVFNGSRWDGQIYPAVRHFIQSSS